MQMRKEVAQGMSIVAQTGAWAAVRSGAIAQQSMSTVAQMEGWAVVKDGVRVFIGNKTKNDFLDEECLEKIAQRWRESSDGESNANGDAKKRSSGSGGGSGDDGESSALDATGEGVEGEEDGGIFGAIKNAQARN